MESYDATAFRGRVDAALQRVKTILDNTKNPQYAADVPHAYDDKYLLAEFVARLGIAATLQALENIGLTREHLTQLRAWAGARSVTLRLVAHEECAFSREAKRRLESAVQHVTEWESGSEKTRRTDKLVATVDEYYWRFDVEWAIVAFQGTDDLRTVRLASRKGGVDIKTPTKVPPRPKSVARDAIDVEIGWLLRQIDDAGRASFSIDRTVAECHTPRRNPAVDDALGAMRDLYGWCARVVRYFWTDVFPAQEGHGLDLQAIHASDVFVPVLPLLEEGRADGPVPVTLADAFLAEQQRSLIAKSVELEKVFPTDASVITSVEANLLFTLLHATQVAQQVSDGVDAIEGMLRDQLIAAIGKELTPDDFSAYMDFHYRKLVKPEYRPKPFSHAVRRPDHYPEGILSVEVERGASPPDPVTTTVAFREAARPMTFALDAATRVQFMGDRYLHAWVAHQFSGPRRAPLHLVARARQFSSFVLLVGRIASADVFEPKYGIVVQNKDVLKIPLMLEPIPTPKEFRDAIESLSPEQQRFAKAFRAMQLESTLFGVCVIQIKPQLERLLKLPDDSLTKEIKLTQDLLTLFVDYQIPSDLLSYDGPDDALASDKLARVKDYVSRMHEMIELSKKKELEEARQREALRLAEMNRTPVAAGPPPQGYGPPPFAPAFGAPAAMAAAPGGGERSPAPMPRSAPAPQATTTAVPAPPPHAVPPQNAPHAAQPRPQGPPISSAGDALDYTRIPAELDRKFEALDEDSALRPTILNPGDRWSRTAQAGLLAAPATKPLAGKEQTEEKNRAFDLLDALSKSGALPVAHASLHVVVAATHCFDRTLLDTVIQGNVNPIEKVERSLMIMATTVHGRSAVELLADDQRERFLAYAPRLGS